MIELESLITDQYPGFMGINRIIKKLALSLLSRLLHFREINEFLSRHKDEDGIRFIDEVFEYLNFSYRIANKDVKKIPAEGKLIVVANHPIGSLDSLALMSAIYNVRNDIKIVANDILSFIDNLNEFLLPYDLEKQTVQRDNIKAIGEALSNEEAVIMFPAGEVSRLKYFRVMDGKWNKGAVHFAKKFNSPVLPVYIQARNSPWFYLASMLNKPVSRVLLSHELFNKKSKIINLKIGDPIPSKVFNSNFINTKTQIKLLKKHVYKIAKGEKGIFATEKNIIHPIDVKALFAEINRSEVLGTTKDGKRILLTDYESSPNVLREIARLREITFRSVGEGSGKKLDLDKFDKYYKHIVVWDDEELEIVGSYRIGLGSEIFLEKGINGFYTSTLFNFKNEFMESYLNDSIELGRSFVQKKYWNSNALNYLWMGIGAFIAARPNLKYLFGPASISNSYPEQAKKMLVYFYNKWFGSVNNLAESKNRFVVPENDFKEFRESFTSEDYRKDYLILKRFMKTFGFTVPVLYKHYTELCDDDGVKFLDFGVDRDFENCTDGLIFVEVDKIKSEKKARYIDTFRSVQAVEV